MAEESLITAVKLQIPNEAESFGFDSNAIGALLDSGLTMAGTILSVLRGISAKSVSMADSITENSSSRSIAFFDKVKQLIDIWAAVVKDEQLAGGTNVKESARIYTSERA